MVTDKNEFCIGIFLNNIQHCIASFMALSQSGGEALDQNTVLVLFVKTESLCRFSYYMLLHIQTPPDQTKIPTVLSVSCDITGCVVIARSLYISSMM